MSYMNRLHNIGNPFQGPAKRVLTVCSAGLLRSPTAAFVLASEPYCYNTRAVGCVKEYALIGVDAILIHWADEIVCMENEHAHILMSLYEEELDSGGRPKIITLNIPDSFKRMDTKLVELIRERYDEATA